MRRTIIPLTLALVLVFAVAQIAAAGWGAGAGSGGRGTGTFCWTNLADELGLTAEQSAQIQELQARHFEKMNQIQDQMRAVRQEMRQLRFQRGVGEAQVQARIDKAGEFRNQMQQEAAAFRTELQGILTDEQLAKWSEMRRGGPCPNPDGPRYFSKMPGGRGGPAQ
ncbi:MAG: periplasmic heavy metal sensor [Bacillota bacterium]